MHAFLLTASTFPDQFNTLLNTPDFLLIDEQPSITIKSIRALKAWLSTKPYQATYKTVVIQAAHTLTLPAQNALLKTLEEPPGHARIYLTCPNPALLLPTIVSRCQIISSPTVQPVTKNIDINFTAMSPGERLARVGEYAISRTAAISFCEQLLSTYRSQLYSGNLRVPLKPVSRALKSLRSNVNPKLVLESLVLYL